MRVRTGFAGGRGLGGLRRVAPAIVTEVCVRIMSSKPVATLIVSRSSVLVLMPYTTPLSEASMSIIRDGVLRGLLVSPVALSMS